MAKTMAMNTTEARICGVSLRWIASTMMVPMPG